MSIIKKKIPILSSDEIEHFYFKALKSVRKRYPKILHLSGDYNNRVFNFLIKDTYMQPHNHPSIEKIENMTVIDGKICVLFFNTKGEIIHKHKLNHLNNNFLSVPAFTWHTYVVLSSRAIVFEEMDGIYNKDTWKTFPKWAPKEDDKNCGQYLDNLVHLSSS